MTGMLMDFSHKKMAKQQSLRLDRGTKDAMADYLRHRWPSGTAKHVARAFDLTMDEAKGAVAGRASQTTIDKIKQAGGWSVVFAVEAMVIGQGADQFLLELRASHDKQAERLGALTDMWTVRDLGGDDPAGMDNPSGERRITGRR